MFDKILLLSLSLLMIQLSLGQMYPDLADKYQETQYKRAPMRFGKRANSLNPRVRADMFYECGDGLMIKRAPMRFGKRAPMRFGKRNIDQ